MGANLRSPAVAPLRPVLTSVVSAYDPTPRPPTVDVCGSVLGRAARRPRLVGAVYAHPLPTSIFVRLDRLGVSAALRGASIGVLVPPRLWLALSASRSSAPGAAPAREVRSLWKAGGIPDDPEHPSQFHNDPKIGPSIYVVNKHYIRPETLRQGGMSWALMKHPKAASPQTLALTSARQSALGQGSLPTPLCHARRLARLAARPGADARARHMARARAQACAREAPHSRSRRGADEAGFRGLSHRTRGTGCTPVVTWAMAPRQAGDAELEGDHSPLRRPRRGPRRWDLPPAACGPCPSTRTPATQGNSRERHRAPLRAMAETAPRSPTGRRRPTLVLGASQAQRSQCEPSSYNAHIALVARGGRIAADAPVNIRSSWAKLGQRWPSFGRKWRWACGHAPDMSLIEILERWWV